MADGISGIFRRKGGKGEHRARSLIWQLVYQILYESQQPQSIKQVLILFQPFILLPSKDRNLYLIPALHERAGQTAIIFTHPLNESHRISIPLLHLGFPAISPLNELTHRTSERGIG